MSQIVLINRITVQNANTVAGFTWGFPAITHFLGFTHNLSRKLAATNEYNDIFLSGCAVVAHHHKVHTYKPSYDYQFIQTRNPAYLKKDVSNLVSKGKTPPIIEEGKMNMTVSLLVGCNGNIGNREKSFNQWLKKACLLQRLAGGTMLDITNVEILRPENSTDVRNLTYKLLPGFFLMDRSIYLEQHFQTLQSKDQNAELLDAWLDFSALKQKARPKSDLITNHLKKIIGIEPDNHHFIDLAQSWQRHLEDPYEKEDIPDDLRRYFGQLEDNKSNKKLKAQWQAYCNPDEKTDADWEFQPKPQKGYLVPIMMGYKAISRVYENHEVANTRDNETDVCFVESVHSIGEWLSAHRIKTLEQLQRCLWRYHYEDNWYLCKQFEQLDGNYAEEHYEISSENPEDDF